MPFVTMSKWRREMLDIFLATLPELLISLLANNIQKPHRLSSSLILRTRLPVTPDLLALSIDTDLSIVSFVLGCYQGLSVASVVNREPAIRTIRRGVANISTNWHRSKPINRDISKIG